MDLFGGTDNPKPNAMPNTDGANMTATVALGPDEPQLPPLPPTPVLAPSVAPVVNPFELLHCSPLLLTGKPHQQSTSFITELQLAPSTFSST